MTSITIREATPVDKKEVLGIHDNVYDGMDCLMEYYDAFLSWPFAIPYVALIDNKIVAFLTAFCFVGGETVITFAGRVDPNVSGKGLFGKLNRVEKRHAFVTSNIFPFANKDSFRSVNKLIVKKPMTRSLLDARCLQTLQDVDRGLHGATDEQLSFYFNNVDVRNYLFPNDRVVVDWVPYRLIEANIPLLRWSGKRTKIYSDVSLKSDGEVKGLLSLSTTIPVKRPPFCCNLNIYGTNSSTLTDHVKSHISHIRKVTNDVTSLLIVVEPDFDVQALEQALLEIGVQKSEWYDTEQPEKTYSHQIVFEREII